MNSGSARNLEDCYYDAAAGEYCQCQQFVLKNHIAKAMTSACIARNVFCLFILQETLLHAGV